MYTTHMSKRLQVVVGDEELEQLRKAAARKGLTLSEWTRQVLHRARETQTGPTRDGKLAALDRALACGHPTGDVTAMLTEIETGRDLR